MTLHVSAEKELVELKNTDGKTVKVELLEKGLDKVKFKKGQKIHTLPLTKLSEESVELIKNADTPQISNFKILCDFDKKGKRHKWQTQGVLDNYNHSYRIDKITGKATLKNMDTQSMSPKAQLHMAILIRSGSSISATAHSVQKIKSLKPLEEVSFASKKTRVKHSEKGYTDSEHENVQKGRYYGYIAAIMIDNKIVAIKSVPDRYERDFTEAKKLLEISTQ